MVGLWPLRAVNTGRLNEKVQVRFRPLGTAAVFADDAPQFRLVQPSGAQRHPAAGNCYPGGGRHRVRLPGPACGGALRRREPGTGEAPPYAAGRSVPLLRRALFCRVGVLLRGFCRYARYRASDASALPVLSLLRPGPEKRHRGDPDRALYPLPSVLQYR